MGRKMAAQSKIGFDQNAVTVSKDTKPFAMSNWRTSSSSGGAKVSVVRL
jgi:hypothetical protein